MCAVKIRAAESHEEVHAQTRLVSQATRADKSGQMWVEPTSLRLEEQNGAVSQVEVDEMLSLYASLVDLQGLVGVSSTDHE
jgi:hypothetical protein